MHFSKINFSSLDGEVRLDISEQTCGQWDCFHNKIIASLSFLEQPWKLIIAQSQEHYEQNAWKLADKQHQGTEEVW